MRGETPNSEHARGCVCVVPANRCSGSHFPAPSAGLLHSVQQGLCPNAAPILGACPCPARRGEVAEGKVRVQRSG
jgi:hypothetical protein